MSSTWTPTARPSTDIEQSIARVWAAALNVDVRTVSVDDDFFQVGGSSINAGQLAGGVRSEFSVPLTVRRCRLNTSG